MKRYVFLFLLILPIFAFSQNNYIETSDELLPGRMFSIWYFQNLETIETIASDNGINLLISYNYDDIIWLDPGPAGISYKIKNVMQILDYNYAMYLYFDQKMGMRVLNVIIINRYFETEYQWASSLLIPVN